MAQSLTENDAAQLRAVIQHEGLEATATRLGLNTTTLLRAACGLQLHNATRILIERSLTHAEG
jgi:hypothetical protein